jgi:agmatinase
MKIVTGICYDSNSSFLQGAAAAPATIRKVAQDGASNFFAENGVEICPGGYYLDAEDLSIESLSSEGAYHAIKYHIHQHLDVGNTVLSLGGDHSISYPIIDTYSEFVHGLHLLHLDAHADLYDDFEGNPYSHASPFARIMEKGKVDSLTQVGIRTLTTHQRRQADRFGVSLIEMKNFDTDFLQKLKGPLYLSIDIDVLDPAFAPGVSHQEAGGMTVRQVLHIIQHLAVPLVGADLVEYNPRQDVNRQTARVAHKIMKEILAVMAPSL